MGVAFDRSVLFDLAATGRRSGSSPNLTPEPSHRPQFSHLTTEQTTRLVAAATVHKYSDGDIIVRQGDKADAIYAVREGGAVARKA